MVNRRQTRREGQESFKNFTKNSYSSVFCIFIFVALLSTLLVFVWLVALLLAFFSGMQSLFYHFLKKIQPLFDPV